MHAHAPGPSAAALPNRTIKLNVGGVRFETNAATLRAAGEGSLLARLAEEALLQKRAELFVDRDPDVFYLLLCLLRSKRLPSLPPNVDLDLLILEASHFGLLSALQSCLLPPALDGLDVEKSRGLLSNGRDLPCALAVEPSDGSLCVGYGSKVTLYDWALRRCSTTLTELNQIRSIHIFRASLVAMGSLDTPGLHLYDVLQRKHRKILTWSDALNPLVFNPTVHAITASPSTIFASFNSSRSSDNTIAFVDPERLEIVDDIGRQKEPPTTAPGKLQWMEQRGLLIAGSTGAGPAGHIGHLRVFDVRSKEQIWDWTEPNVALRAQKKDSFADWAASDDLNGIFKIGVASGDLEFCDLRMLRDEPDPWMLMEETRSGLDKGKGGASNILTVNGKQLFCSRGGDLEVWAEVPLQLGPDEQFWTTSFRRNFLDQRCGLSDGYTITAMAVGCNRLFVNRKELQSVEVWETQRGFRG